MKDFSPSAFARFFTRFPKLLLAGALFSVPFTAFTLLFVAISKLVGYDNIIISGLGIIPSTPFLAGLTMVIRKYAVEKEDVPVVKTFFTAVKDNLLRFLIHGVAFYLIAACSFFAIWYYYSLAQIDIAFGAVLFLYILFTLTLIVMMFYIPVMTVTYELKMKDIYKNSFLLVFGKILRNLIALVLSAVFVLLSAMLMAAFSHGPFYLAVAIVALLLPLLLCYTIISIISKGLQDAVGSFKPAQEPEYSESDREYERQLAANTDSDYVFVNGKMIKRTTEENRPQ